MMKSMFSYSVVITVSILTLQNVKVSNQPATTLPKFIETEAASCVGKPMGSQPLSTYGHMWGVESTDLLQGGSPISPAGAVQVKPDTVAPTTNDTTIDDTQLSDDGTALAYLSVKSSVPISVSQPSGDILAFNIISTDGKQTSLSADSSWWELGPELRPGHFGILAHDKDFNAQILDVSWKDGTLLSQTLETLPFKLLSYPPLDQYFVFISPHWKFLGYVDPTVGKLNIYSRDSHKVIWTVDMQGTIPKLSWIKSGGIAIVNMSSDSGNGEIIKVDTTGNSSLLTDLSKDLGELAIISEITPTDNNNNQIILLIHPLVNSVISGNQYAVLSIDNGQIQNLCLSNVDTNATGIQWINGEYFSVQEAVSNNGLAPYRLFVVSAITGNYTTLYPIYNGRPIWIVGWSKPITPSK